MQVGSGCKQCAMNVHRVHTVLHRNKVFITFASKSCHISRGFFNHDNRLWVEQKYILSHKQYLNFAEEKHFFSGETPRSCPSVQPTLQQTLSLDLLHACENAALALNMSLPLLLNTPAQCKRKTPAQSPEDTGHLCFSF